MTKIILGLVALGVGAFGLIALRDATLSTHQATAPDSRMELVLHVDTHGGEQGQTRTEMAEALVLTCRLEVTSDVAEPSKSLGEGRFRFVLSPALDETDQRQFRGCLEDWAIDHLQAQVERLAPVA
jgi:hypothetical protein